MAKLIFALILFALGIGASRALASMAAAPSGPWLRAAPHLRLASRVVLAIRSASATPLAWAATISAWRWAWISS